MGCSSLSVNCTILRASLKLPPGLARQRFNVEDLGSELSTVWNFSASPVRIDPSTLKVHMEGDSTTENVAADASELNAAQAASIPKKN
jgi:hypothetical protein